MTHHVAAHRLTGRLALTALLLLGGAVAAQADNDVYHDMTRKSRSDDQLHSDSQQCKQRFGAPQNGEPTSRAFKACMRGYGWRFDHTEVEHTWIDPDTGLTCHDILGGLGSSCSNF